jgi:hypothetical protein
MSVVVYFFKKGPPFSREPTRRQILYGKRGPNGMGTPRSKRPHNNHEKTTPHGQAPSVRIRLPRKGNVENSGYSPVDIRISLGSFHEA